LAEDDLSEDDLDADAPLESDEVLDSDEDFVSDAGFESLDVFADESVDEAPLPLAADAPESAESALEPVAFLA
jgi:hypothetical protein